MGAFELIRSELRKSMGDKEKALFQMEQDKLCMPFSEFLRCVEATLGRPVWTHEFGLNRAGLMAELQEHGRAPSFDDVVAMIPAGKAVVVVTP